MKKIIIFSLLFFLSIGLSAQKTWTSAKNGDWNNNDTWIRSGGATGAPKKDVEDNDVIIITSNHTVTFNQDLKFEDEAKLYIINGGKLRMGNGNNAKDFTMESSDNSFYMINGFYESYGSGGDMEIKGGLIDWSNSEVYVSGDYKFEDDVNNISLNNMCIRVGEDLEYDGVGASSNYAVMTNVSHVSGLSGSGDLIIKGKSFIQATDLRLNASSSNSVLKFDDSTIQGTIYSINGTEKIVVEDLDGNPSLQYWCAGELDEDLDDFSGSKIENCTIATEICTGPPPPPPSNTDVGVVKTASVNSVNAGSSITYTIEVTNNGPLAAQNVNVTDNLPTALTITDVVASTGSWSAPTWSVGNMNVGSIQTLEITATVSNTYQGNLVNTAVVSTSTPDSNPNNDESSVTITVNQLTGPTANDDNATTPFNTPVDIEVLLNDVQGDAGLVPSSVSFIPNTAPNPATVGTFTVDPVTGLVTFTPVDGFIGTAAIYYKVCDLNELCDNATITVEVSPEIVGPTANDDNATTPINTAVNIDILENDVEGDAALDPTSVTFIGTVPDADTEGVFTVNSTTGLVTFTPATGFTGTVTIDYQVCDMNTLCDDATITVVITATATGPTAIDDVETTLVNTAVEIPVLSNDIAGSTPLDPTSVTFFSGTEPDAATVGVFTVDGTTGVVTFTPAYNYVGVATIDYQVCDENPLCATATITVTIVEGTNNFYPAHGYGTLAFEDLWPAKGDYDFNDLVIDYQFEILMNHTNFVNQVKATFIIRAFGASYENGFGFQLSPAIDADDLTVTGYSLTENFITLNSNGTEAGQSRATIIVYDNAYNEMQYPGVGIGVNTEEWAPYVQPVTLTITIDFEPDTYDYNQLDIANFNPFIIVNKDRAVEVHLPNYPPTDLADQNKFGMWDDDSNAGTGKYYMTENNLPWAIHIYESFDYPIEKQDIIWVHLKFAEWAVSSGTLFPNWYQNQPGYRNAGLIYTPPSN